MLYAVSESQPNAPLMVILTTRRYVGIITDALEGSGCEYILQDDPVGMTGHLRGHGQPAGSMLVTESTPQERPLTKRELEVLDLISESLTNIQIARRLGIKNSTVKTHVSAILAKSGAGDRAGAVSWAFRRGLIR